MWRTLLVYVIAVSASIAAPAHDAAAQECDSLYRDLADHRAEALTLAPPLRACLPTGKRLGWVYNVEAVAMRQAGRYDDALALIDDYLQRVPAEADSARRAELLLERVLINSKLDHDNALRRDVGTALMYAAALPPHRRYALLLDMCYATIEAGAYQDAARIAAMVDSEAPDSLRRIDAQATFYRADAAVRMWDAGSDVDLRTAAVRAREARRGFEVLGDTAWTGYALVLEAETRGRTGSDVDALFNRALDLAGATGHARLRILTHFRAGELAMHRLQLDQAERHFANVLMYSTDGHREFFARAVDSLQRIAASRSESDDAAAPGWLWALACALAGGMGLIGFVAGRRLVQQRPTIRTTPETPPPPRDDRDWTMIPVLNAHLEETGRYQPILSSKLPDVVAYVEMDGALLLCCILPDMGESTHYVMYRDDHVSIEERPAEYRGALLARQAIRAPRER